MRLATTVEHEQANEPVKPALRVNMLRSVWTIANGIPIHALHSDDGANSHRPPLVLVHGLGLSGRYMLPVAVELARHYEVYVPDLPGFGDSSKPPRALDVPGLADAVSAWMKAMNIPTAAFLGNSFACQIIADLAARHPECVERAVLQGPTAPPDERSWFWQFVRWQQNNKFNPKSMGPMTWADYRKAGYRRVLRTFHYSLRDHLEDKLPHIEAPVLVVRGERDPICGQPWADMLANGLKRGRLAVIPKVAHTLVYTSPRELAEVCRPFLDERSGASD